MAVQRHCHFGSTLFWVFFFIVFTYLPLYYRTRRKVAAANTSLKCEAYVKKLKTFHDIEDLL